MGCVADLPPIAVARQGGTDATSFVAADESCLTLLEPFETSRAKAAVDAIAVILRAKPRPMGEAFRLLDTLSEASTRDEFITSLDAIHVAFVARRFPQAEFVLLCLHLYVRGVVLFPRNFVRGGETLFSPVYTNQSTPVTASTAPELASLQERVRRHARAKANNNLDLVSRWAIRAVVTVGPFTPDLVLDESIARILAEFAPAQDRKYWAFREAIHAINRSAGSDGFTGDLNTILRPLVRAEHALAAVSTTVPARRSTRRSDQTFAWALMKDRSVEPWRHLLASWIGSMKARKRLTSDVMLANHLLDFLILNPEVTRNPAEFLRADYPLAGTFLVYIAEKKTETIAKAHTFFEYALDTLCCIDDEGTPYRLRGFANPVPQDAIPPSRTYSGGQTHRLAMPVAWVTILQDIITRDGFRWAKETFASSDWLRVADPVTGEATSVWNPVRAYLVLLKLYLPLRTHQVRMLDSGEGDRDVIDASSRTWVKNGFGVALSEADQGVLRRIWDPERTSWFTGIFVNTNKTQDRVGDVDQGYVIPWENEQVIRLVLDLREWQVRYNPLTCPTPFEHLPDAREASSDVVACTPARYYLFRDATSDKRAVPVTSSRMRGFWNALCAELEEELQRRGIRNQDGTAIEIIDSWRDEPSGSVPATSIFDLHSLRVTGLTAFAKAGVPIAVLSKLVAGHASILMTLYYARLDIGYVSEVLTDAQVKLDGQAQTEMASFIKALSVTELSLRTVCNSVQGLESAKRTQPAIWQWMDHGICPNGRTRCHEGGEAVVDQKDRKFHGPVRGGAGNCALCRFFVTGHQFLPGLVAKLNETSFEATERSRTWRSRNQAEQGLRAARIAAEDAGEAQRPQQDAELIRASSAAEDAMHELDVCAETMHAYHNLVEQAVAIARREVPATDDAAGSKETALIVNAPEGSSIDIDYVEVPEFELVDEICRTSRFYRSINWTTANLRRKEIFNRMLMRNGLEPVYVGLSDEISKIALDAASDLLRRRMSRGKLNRLMSGETRLKELGLLEETVSLIEQQIGRPVHRVLMIEASGEPTAKWPLLIPAPALVEA
ncbi:VPA1269 family protein [Methylobacterium sp. WL116]|uniref:VPA1269 family protein n=1 Tax=Methylobacterium sp. WL116 TaxID=2603889 RepID=UPI0011C82EF1|nr:VPA1269 family protein [Methylobacterium sp. WL116]TXM93890.1 hypothetical protein FV223_06765 [Methylobacterium sp. WL116]